MASSITLYDDSGNPVVVDGETVGIETITNANGTAVKYPDGTMVCYGKHSTKTVVDIAYGNMFRSATVAVTFPVGFLGTPVVNCFADNGADGYVGVWAGNTWGSGGIGVSTRLLSANSTTGAYLSYHAIGRWK